MNTSLKDIFNWLVNAPIWLLVSIPFVIFAIIISIELLQEMHQGFKTKITLNTDGTERYGGNFLYWTLVIIICVLTIEGTKLLLGID